MLIWLHQQISSHIKYEGQQPDGKSFRQTHLKGLLCLYLSISILYFMDVRKERKEKEA